MSTSLRACFRQHELRVMRKSVECRAVSISQRSAALRPSSRVLHERTSRLDGLHECAFCTGEEVGRSAAAFLSEVFISASTEFGVLLSSAGRQLYYRPRPGALKLSRIKTTSCCPPGQAGPKKATAQAAESPRLVL